MNQLSVSQLNEQIKALLENSFSRVIVEGELSRITFHNSGHVYFTLKDKDSAISCVLFRGNASKLKFRLEEGMRVIVDGAISLYKPRGSYQINCFSITPSGQGALALAYEQLKERLSQKGYFDPSIKKTLPKFPKKIAFVTSATGAALQDMLMVANKRYPLLEIDIYDVLVQGENSANSIALAIKKADANKYDFIVIGRGGGSIEDLYSFNEEIVADAVFNAKTPIVSAVGHEIDYVISDFVADLRAPTPSAAMELTLPDINELYLYMDELALNFSRNMEHKLQIKSQQLQHLKNSFMQHSSEKKLSQKADEIKQLQDRFNSAVEFKLQTKQKNFEQILVQYPQTIDSTLNFAQNQLINLKKMLESQNPKYKNKRGFAQISKDSKVIDISTLDTGDIFEAQSDRVIVSAKVLTKENII